MLWKGLKSHLNTIFSIVFASASSLKWPGPKLVCIKEISVCLLRITLRREHEPIQNFWKTRQNINMAIIAIYLVNLSISLLKMGITLTIFNWSGKNSWIKWSIANVSKRYFLVLREERATLETFVSDTEKRNISYLMTIGKSLT